MAKEMKKIMVTGSVGQIGSELTMALREKYGNDNVLATGHRTKPKPELRDSGPFEFINVAKRETIEEVVKKYNIDTIYHLSAILSAVGEKNPYLAWDVNMNGTYNILEAAREHDMTRIFVPSSIAVFGPETPLDNTYAVAIYFEAVKNKKYTCFVKEETMLPMMYMPDCLKAAMDLMEADFSKLKHHSDFNVTGMSFTAGELAAEIKKHIPEFVCEYEPDFRQDIADSWPNSLDDSAAREEWGWQPSYDLAAMTEDMLRVLSQRHSEGKLDY